MSKPLRSIAPLKEWSGLTQYIRKTTSHKGDRTTQTTNMKTGQTTISTSSGDTKGGDRVTQSVNPSRMPRLTYTSNGGSGGLTTRRYWQMSNPKPRSLNVGALKQEKIKRYRGGLDGLVGGILGGGRKRSEGEGGLLGKMFGGLNGVSPIRAAAGGVLGYFFNKKDAPSTNPPPLSNSDELMKMKQKVISQMDQREIDSAKEKKRREKWDAKHGEKPTLHENRKSLRDIVPIKEGWKRALGMSATAAGAGALVGASTIGGAPIGAPAGAAIGFGAYALSGGLKKDWKYKKDKEVKEKKAP